MYRTVDRRSFSAIQSALFPTYFSLQTALPIVLALTFPGNSLIGLPNGVKGLLDPFCRWHSLAPIAAMCASGFINLVVLLPMVTKVMKERRGQGKRDGKEWDTTGNHSQEMRALNKKFGILHGVSSLLNLTTFIAALAYGFTLGARVQSILDHAP
jgi:p-aminobenzoyl-glutamate transporter AbgT